MRKLRAKKTASSRSPDDRHDGGELVTTTAAKKKVKGHPKDPTPSWRGVRKKGGGYAHLVEPPPEYRGTSAQVCGLWPWAAGGSAPTTGVPIGHHMISKTTVCCDPISWFTDAKLLSNPSAFLLGLPGLGKSSIVRRMEIGLAGAGVTPMTLGDTKPDHRDTTLQLGGQVVEIGRGRGSINVLDLGALDAAAQRLTGKAAHALREDAHGRRLNMVIALVALIRQGTVTDTEKAVLSAALRVLADQHSPQNPAVLTDLVALLDNPPDVVRTPTLDRGDSEVYRHVVDPLQRSVIALLEGPLGSVFAQPTTTRLALDAPAICVDVSSLSGHDKELEAAVLLATWAEGYGTIEAANALADAGLAPQRRFIVVLDELWRVLRGAPGMVDRIDALTRLNRTQGVGQIMITHTLSDLRALPLAEDRAKARGFVERAGMIILGGLPAQELAEVTEIVRLSEAEKSLVTSWSSPPSLSQSSEPPGRGNFLLKIGGRPGIPVHLDFTQAEIDSGIHDTNQRWHEKAPVPAARINPDPTIDQSQHVTEEPMPDNTIPAANVELPDPGSQWPDTEGPGREWAAALAALTQPEEPASADHEATTDIAEQPESGTEERPLARPTLLENAAAAFANLEQLTTPASQRQDIVEVAQHEPDVDERDPWEDVFAAGESLAPDEPAPAAFVVPKVNTNPEHEPAAGAPVRPRFTLEEVLANPDQFEHRFPAPETATAELEQTIDLIETRGASARRLRRKVNNEQAAPAASTNARSLSELMGGSLGDQT